MRSFVSYGRRESRAGEASATVELECLQSQASQGEAFAQKTRKEVGRNGKAFSGFSGLDANRKLYRVLVSIVDLRGKCAEGAT